VQSYEMELKARELMEEACSELTREVEEDQAEVELLRRDCACTCGRRLRRSVLFLCNLHCRL